MIRSRDTGVRCHTVMGLPVSAGCTFVPWESVEDYGSGEVHLKAARKQLPRV
ncbi:hypothetical protein [Thermoactinospora rubra]|uniref:hypothetical protein n=1 Tax=Thermoactinospora rubra TaxID=1088767 RepID=UPI001301BD0A|nr:hypothetical protein [Thermoactinospora rubra]